MRQQLMVLFLALIMILMGVPASAATFIELELSRPGLPFHRYCEWRMVNVDQIVHLKQLRSGRCFISRDGRDLGLMAAPTTWVAEKSCSEILAMIQEAKNETQ